MPCPEPRSRIRRPPPRTPRVTTARSGFPTSISAPRLQGRFLLDFLKHNESDTLYLVGDIIDGWRLRKGLVLAAGAQRRGAEAAAQGAQGHAGRSTCPATTTSVRAQFMRHGVRRHRGGATRRSTSTPTAGAAGAARRPVRRRDAATPAGSPIWATWAYTLIADAQPLVQRAAHAPGLPLLVAVGLPQAQGQERGQLSSPTSRVVDRRGAARAASTASCAATSTTPRSATSTASLYCNDGDWVESCTALVEHADGRLEVVALAATAWTMPAPALKATVMATP